MIKIVTFVFLVILDLFTKFLIQNYLLLGQSIKINKFIDIVYVQNYGVSFGLFSGEIPYWVLVIIGLLVVILILYLLIISYKNLEKNAYFLIIAGAMGNIIDRVLNSYVVDFISLHYKTFYWPAFNFADIYITIGIIMLLITFFFKSEYR